MSDGLNFHAKIAILATCVLGAAASAVTAKAATISYSVTGVAAASYPSGQTPPLDAYWGPNGYPGDSIGLDSYSGTLDLTPGVQTIALNALQWTVNPTYGGTTEQDWVNYTFPLNLDRSITLDGVTGGLTQSGSLYSTYFTDTLSVAASASHSLVVDGYRVTITGQATAPVDAGDFGPQAAQTLYATVNIAAVPEPSTWAMLILGVGGVGAMLRSNRGKPIPTAFI